MYVNAKMTPGKTISGMGRREIKKRGEWDEFKYDIVDTL
jgi:hypothetical protein